MSTRAAKDSYQVVLLPGDGIGPEVMAQARDLLEAVAEPSGVRFELDEIPCGGRFYLEHGARDWPEDAEARCRGADVILLGAVGWPSPDGPGPVMMGNGNMAGHSAVIGNRVDLDLYANVRPVKLLPGVAHRISGTRQQVWRPEHVDMVILRENTEGLYAGMGGQLRVGGSASVATDTRLITRRGCERIIRRAFELCEQRGRGAPGDGVKRVTGIVKHNVLEGCKLFAEVFAEVASEYPDIANELAIVDAFTQWLVTQPEHYDVCVTTNLFGDIVTDLASVLQGGMGMAVGCNVGDEHAMFEPIHGSAPPLAGKDEANPMAMLLATGEALAWLGQRHDDPRLRAIAHAVERAVATVAERGAPLTVDLVGAEQAASLSAVAAAVREHTLRLLGEAAPATENT
ncbi:isocitrate/isopropylmalate dehydrogenase family protein [Haliangium ochraceum]|uniref:3-isopropylmalate dehydrogenase n=1 Tax=Haliangium ochraceum (strain DSM 14365 / JCM 11303 / SMP-2) TaxID=502025 RepID=D0LNY3_HALO1|nr:isocitrate/isopropylmalate family dehydrogenase [Haliangium ochraceum]ACY18809.1 3-isopropylmalate dehydrogenase [Haliangium ochraceum DSM 14365]